MPDPTTHGTNPASELSPVKRALQEIRALRARLEQLESAQHEAIAIVGTGIRFPGSVVDEASFWKLLAEGKDAITEIPRERWDWRTYFNADADAPGSMYTQHGGFLEGVDLFDAAFFGISPREAAAMDPQHRLILEVGWEALENAGYSTAALQKSQTGVFLGIANNDYGRAALGDLENIDAYTGSGNSPAMVAGRLSYVLGLHGPSLAIDTSCSSSLVAIHLACASLRAGECDAALAGGVNLILTPESNVALSKAHMMARDGRCKTFDDAADGYVRSEGCCVLFLRKLSDAVADGDRILAVIRGSAVNHDGHSGGLTAPNGPAQAAVIRRALEAAQVQPSDIGYIETHGTGTELGDPIEVETLASVMGLGRACENPLAIGSVKTNIGHTEAASGIAGLMKTVLALHHRVIPPSLHLNKKNSHIDWDSMPVIVPTLRMDWPPVNGQRYAGVSSFGFSGTNAHVVLEEAPKSQLTDHAVDHPRQILTISARTATALDTLRTQYAAALRDCSADALANFCFTANTGRTHFAHRLAVIAETAEQMVQALEPAGASASSARLFTGIADTSDAAPRICYLFTGQGSQYEGMGRELYEGSEVFRAGIERCAAAWKQETGESLTEVLYGAESSSGSNRMKEARYAQPALFAFEYALAEMWRSWGMEPSVVLGHSLGEYVAAVIAGVFSLEDGLKLVCARARLMDTLQRRGAMRSIAATAERVRQEIAGLEREVGIGVVNGAESVVLSGDAATVERVARKLEGERIRTRTLEVTHAFHSPLLEPILEEFERVAGEVQYHAPRIRIISNLTGKAARAEEITTPRYWRQHMRQTVEFHAGLQTALETGCETFLEIGPQPHLKALAVRSDASLEPRIKISIRRPRNDWDQVLETLATLYVEGHNVHWSELDKGHSRNRVALPTYPFERQRYWLVGQERDSSQQIWKRASSAALSQSKLAPIGLKVESFPAKWDSLERLTLLEMVRTLRGLGAFTEPEVSHDTQSLAASCGILPAHTKLMARWLQRLSAAGCLEKVGSQFRATARWDDTDLEDAWRDVETRLCDDPFLLQYLRNCSKHLSSVLVGRTSPLETLFPGGSPELARNLYENSSGARYANLIIASAVHAACGANLPSGRVRVLELGGGTGATTASVLPTLPSGGVSYLFTDISEVFLQRASERFSYYPFLRYALLDIENEEHLNRRRAMFDVVIAANVVHATKNLHATLTGIANLLVPGGTVILLETTQQLAWHDISTGLIEGWQKSDDELRDGATLLGVEEWTSALQQAGFEQVVSAPEAQSPAGAIGLHVLLAKASTVGRATLSETTQTSTALYEIPRSAWQPMTDVALVSTGSSDTSTIAALLQESPTAEHHATLLDLVSKEIAQVLRLGPNAMPGKRDRLMDLGMDSLMAVELRNKLTLRLGVDNLPATLIFDYPTPDAIAAYLLGRIEGGVSIGEEISSLRPAIPEKLLTADEVEELSENDVAALLRSRLA